MLSLLQRFLNTKTAPPAGASEAARRGRLGEQIAARHVRKVLGYRLLCRNWRAGNDEIDLVCKDHEVLVFIEVRARAESALVSGYHSVDKRKKTALARVCKAYLRALRSAPRHFRFDIIEVALSNDGTTGTVSHFENVPLFNRRFVPETHHTYHD